MMGTPRTVMRLDADTANAVRAILKVVDASGKSTKSFKKQGKAAGRADKAIGGLGGKMAGLVSAGAAIGAIATGFGSIAESAERAMAHVGTITNDLKDLNQLMGSVGETRQAKALAKGISLDAGISSAESLKLVVKGKQGGLSDDEIRSAGKLSLIENDPIGVTRRVADIKAAFGDEALGGSLRSIVNAAGEAQKPSAVNVGQLLGLTLGPAKIAQLVGGSVREAMATVAIATVGAEEPSIAKTQTQAFIKALSKDERFRDEGTLIEDFKRFAALPQEDQRKIVGDSQEAILGAKGIIPRIGQIETLLGKIGEGIEKTGTPESFINQKRRQALEDPHIRTEFESQKAKQQLVFAEDQRGLRATQRQTIEDTVLAKVEDERAGAEGFGRMMLSLESLFIRIDQSITSRIDNAADVDPETIVRSYSQVLGADETNRMLAEMEKQTELLRSLHNSGRLAPSGTPLD